MALIIPQEKKPKVVVPPIEKPKMLSVAEISETARGLIANVEKVIVGKREQI